MQAQDLQLGDEFHDGNGALVYTVIWEPQVGRDVVDLRVQWALDGGQTDRTLPMNVDIPGLVHPIPPGE